MKYIVILGDGMADLPIESLGGKTPLQAAKKADDELPRCKKGEMGMVKTVPDGIAPGSDVANLSVMGYDPTKVLHGPLPAGGGVSGAKLAKGDVTYRVNTVTLSDEEDFSKRPCSTTAPTKSARQRARSLSTRSARRSAATQSSFMRARATAT